MYEIIFLEKEFVKIVINWGLGKYYNRLKLYGMLMLRELSDFFVEMEFVEFDFW